MRAIESKKPADERICYDPYARAFVSNMMWLLSKIFVETGYAEKRGPGVMAFMLARERYIDDFIKARLSEGIKQVVILGAGFDARAYRMPELQRLRVFEVDHPATQAVKRKRLKKVVDPPPPQVTFVPVDFDTQTLAERLTASGYEERCKTLFVWQGVVHYLTKEGVNSTLEFIAHHSAPGSAVIFDYVYSDYMQDTSHGEVERMQRSARVTGEGLVFGIARGQAAPFLAQRGFTNIRDVSAADLKRMYFSGPNAGRVMASGYAIVSADIP